MTARESKHLLRNEMQEKLRALTRKEKYRASQTIIAKLHNLDFYKKCSMIYGFIPLSSEPDLCELYDLALKEGKQVAFPVCAADGTMEYHLVNEQWRERRIKSPWGNWEVHSKTKAHPKAPDCALILVPGLAFTSKGERLGRSMGFFDRFLAQRQGQCPAVGVCFSLQLLESLPTEWHDSLVDLVVTEAL